MSLMVGTAKSEDPRRADRTARIVWSALSIITSSVCHCPSVTLCIATHRVGVDG